MNTTTEIIKLWGDMSPAEEAVFLVYSEDNMYRDIFCDSLKRLLDKRFVIGESVVISPDSIIKDFILDMGNPFPEDDLLGEIYNSIFKHLGNILFFQSVFSYLFDQIMPTEFIIINGWRHLIDIEILNDDFDIQNIVTIKLESSIDSDFDTNLRDFDKFDYVFSEFKMEEGFTKDLIDKLNSMIEDIYLKENKNV